jgi:hypothetical protein
MAAYQYWATHLVTGEVLADQLPLNVSSFGRQINGVGQLSGSLPLNVRGASTYLEALEPRRTVLWVSQDGYPVWNGILWDWTHQSILDGTLPIGAATMESLFQHRQIDQNLNYASMDVADIFAALIQFALAKPYGQIAGIQPPQTPTGITASVSYNGTDLRKVYDAWSDLVGTYNVEYTMTPAVTGPTYATSVQVGNPTLGRVLPAGLVFQFPGNLIDYGFPRTGSSSANTLIATAPPNGSAASWASQLPHGQDAADLAAGYPLLEDTVSYSGIGVTTRAQINAYADGILPSRTGAQETPQVSLGGGQHPLLREIQLGDWCWLVATSPLHTAGPGGQPGLQTPARITGWTCTPPGENQAEVTKVQLGGISL